MHISCLINCHFAHKSKTDNVRKKIIQVFLNMKVLTIEHSIFVFTKIDNLESDIIVALNWYNLHDF